MAAARYSGVVVHIDESVNHAELRVAGMQDVSVNLHDLRAIGCDRLGAPVSFEHGDLRGGNSGGVRLAKAVERP